MGQIINRGRKSATKKGGLIRKIQEYVLRGKEIYVGLEDSKKSWKVCVRNGWMVVNEAGMPAEYETLRNYFKNKFLDYKKRVMYKADYMDLN